MTLANSAMLSSDVSAGFDPLYGSAYEAKNAAYLGRGDRFDRALTGFAQDYADRNERDHEALRAAVRSGRVRAETP